MNEQGYILTLELKQRAMRYLNLLKLSKVKGRVYINISEISSSLGFDDQIIADDMNLMGFYHASDNLAISDIIDCIETTFAVKKYNEAFLICSSSPGKNLISSKQLNINGIKVVAAFDPSPSFQPYDIDGIKVMGLDRMKNLASRMHIRFIVIATLDEFVQVSVDSAVDANAKIILNTAKTSPVTPESVIYAQNNYEDLSNTIKSLFTKLTN